VRARSGELELEYDTFGRSGDAPLLLIMGLGTQMIAWPPAFCELLVERGFYVIRFDNRDIGLSTYFDQVPPPSTLDIVLRRLHPAYTLDDMAADAAGLLDHLGIARAHVAGASMGGMIAQLMALNFPGRVLSLTSIMSNVGGRDSTWPRLRAVWRLLLPPARDRDSRIRRQVETARVLAGGNPIDEQAALVAAAAAVSRSYHPAGRSRQLAAASAAPSRRRRLAELRVPSLVVHGADDPLVPLENGRRTAAAIPGARLLVIERMGHNLPAHAWEPIADAIAAVAGRSESLQTLS
jgi:pimeloyl-ACP methyl ester carboxylesterase